MDVVDVLQSRCVVPAGMNGDDEVIRIGQGGEVGRLATDAAGAVEPEQRFALACAVDGWVPLAVTDGDGLRLDGHDSHLGWYWAFVSVALSSGGIVPDGPGDDESVDEHAAIDRERDAGDVAGFVRDEEEGGIAHVPAAALDAERG